MLPVDASSSPRLQISLITETYPPEVNGVALTLQRLLNELLAEGHHLQLVRPRQFRGDDGREDSTIETLTYPGLPLPKYPDLRLGLPAYFDLKKRWRQRQPHLIHIATEGPLGLSALYAAKHLNIPITSGFHTNFHRYSEHYGLGFLQNTITAYLRYFHNQCDCTLVPTQALQAELTDKGFKRVQILSRGIDTQAFNPKHRSDALRAEWGVTATDPVALYVGRLAAEKNLAVAVKAFQEMRRACPTTKFVLVGSGPLHEPLQQRYPDLIFAGVQKHQALSNYYASADLFLFPSQTETFGNVILEAMASGLAVVAFDDAAAKEHLRDGENGRCVPCDQESAFIQGDQESAFIQAAVELVTDLPRIKQLGASAFEAMQSNSWQQVSSQLSDLFRAFARPTENDS